MAEDDVRARSTILVVEDDEATRIAIVALLTSRGFATATARHGRDALEVMRELVPDLILFDVRMVEMDGHAFRAAQRVDARCSAVPVIAMTAEPPSWGHSIRLAAPVLYKPFRADALYAMIERELRPSPEPRTAGVEARAVDGVTEVRVDRVDGHHADPEP